MFEDDNTQEAEERQLGYFRNFMWLKDGRLIEVGMTFENIQKAYDVDIGGRFQVFFPKYVKPPLNPWHILAPLEVIEVFTAERGY